MSSAAGQAGQALSGFRLALAGFVLALANFIVILDMTIANVSIPHIAGALGVTPQNGTYVVTSYSVAEAICVPLTGFLVGRYGAVRCFLVSLAGFGLFSVLCGLSSSIGLLVAFRLGQGFCGGPLMPLTQTLLLRIFPPSKQGAATAMWAMTTVTAPIAGPILGGWISDGWSWRWIFFINAPVVLFAVIGVWFLLRRFETARVRARIDVVGMLLLVAWVGALQLMLDLGREEDWFNSGFIRTCAAIAAVGFVGFVIWELTEPQPAVDLRIFRHRGFTMCFIVVSLAFGTFFASIVVIPQWLQTSMGYTATDAGYAMSLHGVTALIAAPLIARWLPRVDARAIACFGIGWLGITTLVRLGFNTSAPFWTFAFPQLIQGIGIACFFFPLTVISNSSVEPHEIPSAAGLMNFGRTLSGAFVAALTLTYWSNQTSTAHDRLIGALNDPAGTVAIAGQATGAADPVVGATMLDQLVSQQASLLGLMHVFVISAAVFFLAASLVWLTPRPKVLAGTTPMEH